MLNQSSITESQGPFQLQNDSSTLPSFRSQFTLKSLTLDDVCAFRQANTPPLWTEPDHWDQLAKHFGLLKDGALVAVFRMNECHDGQLPINEYLPLMPVTPDDFQFGRLMVATDQRRGKACVHLLHEFTGMLKQVKGRIFITPLDFDDGGLNQHTFRKLGFEQIAEPVELAGGRTLKPMMRPKPDYSTCRMAA